MQGWIKENKKQKNEKIETYKEKNIKAERVTK